MDWKKAGYWLVLGLMAATTAYTYTIRHHKVISATGADFSRMPQTVGDWAGTDFTFGAAVLDVLKADKTFFRRYVNSRGEEVWLFIGYWANQKYGAQPHSPLHCLPGSGWNIVANELVPLTAASNGNGAAGPQKVNFATIANGNVTESMLYWYQTRSGVLAKETSVKFDLARNSLFRKPTDAAFVRITSPHSEGGSEMSLKLLQDFWSEIAPNLHDALPF